MGLIRALIALIKLPFQILGALLELVGLVLNIVLWPIMFVLRLLGLGGGGGCPNCGSNKIQRLPSGGHQCKNCGYAE